MSVSSLITLRRGLAVVTLVATGLACCAVVVFLGLAIAAQSLADQAGLIAATLAVLALGVAGMFAIASMSKANWQFVWLPVLVLGTMTVSAAWIAASFFKLIIGPNGSLTDLKSLDASVHYLKALTGYCALLVGLISSVFLERTLLRRTGGAA
ncbi:MAG: hypothetical protein ACR2O2_06995 [Ruegeria sp.]